jgi:hypothetical protein
MKQTLIILIFILSFKTAVSQELNCSVIVNYNRIQGTNIEVFQTLQKDIFEFMNNRKWTNNVYATNERIECQILINLSTFNGIDKFTGTVSVQANRPVFNTNYKSILLNHKEGDDLFEFNYVEGQALEFNENTHISNLTSVLAFYAYIIIGLDYDSFANLGGTEYFQKARTIVSNAQSAIEGGWKAYESTDETNRYYIIEHILSNTNAPLRKFYYKYHRLGMDVMSDNIETGRTEITNSLMMLQTVFRSKPDSYFLKILMTTKLSEFINVFSEAPELEKRKIYNILKEIDPTSPKIDKLISTN